jgi:hypothetical protein
MKKAYLKPSVTSLGLLPSVTKLVYSYGNNFCDKFFS